MYSDDYAPLRGRCRLPSPFKRRADFSLSFLVALAFCGAAVAGASAQDPVPTRTVGFSAITFNNATVASALDSLKQQGRKYGFNVIAADANGDPRTQLIQLEAWLNAKRVEAILLLPVAVDALLPAFDLAEKVGIPISTSAVPKNYTSQNVVTVAFDWKTMGRLGGQALLSCQAKRLKGAPLQVAIVEQPPNPGLTEARIEGIKEVLSKGTDAKVLAEIGPNPDNRAQVYKNVAAALRANPAINALIGTNHEQTIGALLGAKSVGLRPKEMCIVEVDHQPEVSSYLTSGELFGAVDIHLTDIQTPFNAKVLAEMMDGKGAEYRGKVINTEITAVETSAP